MNRKLGFAASILLGVGVLLVTGSPATAHGPGGFSGGGFSGGSFHSGGFSGGSFHSGGFYGGGRSLGSFESHGPGMMSAGRFSNGELGTFSRGPESPKASGVIPSPGPTGGTAKRGRMGVISTTTMTSIVVSDSRPSGFPIGTGCTECHIPTCMTMDMTRTHRDITRQTTIMASLPAR